MNSISVEMLEAAKIDGVGWVRELWNLIIPSIWPTLSTILLMKVVGIFTSSGSVLLLTQGKFDTYTISYWLYECVLNGSQFELASAVGLSFTICSVPIVILANKLFDYIDRKMGV